MVWLAPWGDVSKAHPWRNIIVHQTEGPAGSARGGAQEQAKNPTRRGVTVWVETDGTVYWAVPETLVPTHTDGADRNDNKYIDNGKTFHQVNKDTSIGVEFAGNYPDVTRGATEAQIAAWRILVKVLRARYGIPLERVYAHNWIDYKDARYCEGCALATLAQAVGRMSSRSERLRHPAERTLLLEVQQNPGALFAAFMAGAAAPARFKAGNSQCQHRPRSREAVGIYSVHGVRALRLIPAAMLLLQAAVPAARRSRASRSWKRTAFTLSSARCSVSRSPTIRQEKALQMRRRIASS